MDFENLNGILTNLLGEREMGQEKALRLFNICKNIIEERRPWRALVKSDLSKTWGSGDTYQTTKALPTDFGSFDGNEAIKLIPSNGSPTILKQIPLKSAEEFKSYSGYFYVDYANNTFSITGTADKEYTVSISYVSTSPDIDEDNAWVFPSRFHPVLAYMVSGMEKGGINYDDIFAKMTPENRSQAQAILSSLIKWDDRIKRQELGL